MFFLLAIGILREDTLPLPEPPSQLSAFQQRPLQYVLDILSTMDTVSDEYNDDEIDVDHDPDCQVGWIITINCLTI